MFKAILFDCDGVLLDSEPLGAAALTEALRAAGYPLSLNEAAMMFSGHADADARALLQAQGIDADKISIEANRLLYAMFDREIPMIPGVDRVLAGFAVPMAVCSNASRQRLERSLLRSPLAPRFGRHIWSADDVTRPKPAPDMALAACAALGLAPQQAVFIDDNIHGMRCARQAGCIAIGFIGPSDHRPEHEARLRAAGADHIARGMDECHALLTRLSPSLAA